MIYEYQNKDTGEIIEKDFPFGEAPSTVKHEGKTYKRYFLNQVAQVPDSFSYHAHNDTYNYDKSPSGKKRFY